MSFRCLGPSLAWPPSSQSHMGAQRTHSTGATPACTRQSGRQRSGRLAAATRAANPRAQPLRGCPHLSKASLVVACNPEGSRGPSRQGLLPTREARGLRVAAASHSIAQCVPASPASAAILFPQLPVTLVSFKLHGCTVLRTLVASQIRGRIRRSVCSAGAGNWATGLPGWRRLRLAGDALSLPIDKPISAANIEPHYHKTCCRTSATLQKINTLSMHGAVRPAPPLPRRPPAPH